LGEVCVKGGWVERTMTETSLWGFIGVLCEEVKRGMREKEDRGRRRERMRNRKRTGK
jgi:hypothetical protein